jgi:hypothetical protein
VANRRRADGGTHLGGGENGEREGSLARLTVFIGEGKRERERKLWGGPLESVSDVDVEPDRRAIGTRQVPRFPGH